MEEMQRPELNRWIEQAGHPPGWSCSRDPRHSDGSLPLPTGSLRTRPAIRGSDLTAIWADILGYLLTAADDREEEISVDLGGYRLPFFTVGRLI